MDFHALKEGARLPLGPYSVSKQEIVDYAREFDPATFHLDEEAAKDSLLGGLSASGWQTCAFAMRMMCDAYVLQSNSLGSPGIKYCRWLKPVLSGDTLSGISTVVSLRISQSRPGVGIAEFEHVLENQHNERVMEMANTGFFRLSEPAST